MFSSSDIILISFSYQDHEKRKIQFLKYIFLNLLIVERGRGERNTHLLFYTFMRSLVDSHWCPDWVLVSQPGRIGMTLQVTELPGQGLLSAF